MQDSGYHMEPLVFAKHTDEPVLGPSLALFPQKLTAMALPSRQCKPTTSVITLKGVVTTFHPSYRDTQASQDTEAHHAC